MRPKAPCGDRVAARAARLALVLAALQLGACATRSPHYYADDGPPERAPADLGATPDAVPRAEPLNPHANRSYVALGRTYSPDTSDAPFQQRGIASWYGRQFHGNRTSSGEPYDMFAMTAAHPTLPIPSYARVTSVRDGRSVIVRINDRGPFLHDRVIDLSYAAATRLGLAAPGSGEVIVQKITLRQIAAGPRGWTPAPGPAPAGGAAAIAAAPAAAGAQAPVAMAPAIAAPATRVAEGAGAALPSWSVQLGAFSAAANAQALRERIALLLAAPEAGDVPRGARSPRVEFDGRLHRVLIGSLGDRDTARNWSEHLQRFLARDTALYFH